MPKITDPTGNSSVQMEAEIAIRELLQSEFKNKLIPKVLTISEGIHVTVDAATPDDSVLIEIFARQGKLLDGQKKKLAKDILKLAILRENTPKPRVILAFANPSIKKHLSEESWISVAVSHFGIELRDVFNDLDDDLKRRITSAQKVQGKK